MPHIVSQNPVAIIGLDAATFDVIGPWIEDGTLPNLQRLVREGSHGRLRSTVHPISPVAWASAVTGKSPGKHGVFDWRERDPQTYHAGLVTARSVQGPTIWQMVNALGGLAGVVNVPLTYPPAPLDGYLVSGILTPPGVRSFTYPEPLAGELDRAADGYRIFFGETYREGEEQRFLDAIHATLEKRRQAILHLLRSRPTDLTLVVFMESDHVQHDFWKYMDVRFPGYRPEYARYQYAIRDVFVALDRIVGEMLAALPPNVTAFVVSDHGAGPLYKVVYIERYLIQQGLMRLKDSPTTRFKRWAIGLDLPVKGYQALLRLGIDARQWVPKRHRTRLMDAGMSASDVDWTRTRAYSCGDFGQIAVNLRGRERFGCVDPADYEAVRTEICAALRDLQDPETGERVVDNVYRREEVYEGPYVETAPDILFSMKGYGYVTSRRLGLNSDALMEAHRFGRSGNSGSHSMDGILIAHGPRIRAGQALRDARLVDLVPTALHVMGLPIPEDLDGRVLEEIVVPDGLDEQLRPRRAQGDDAAQPPEEIVYSDEERAEVTRRLEELGYLG